MNTSAGRTSRIAGTWRKSSRSANNAHCVEVAVAAEVVGVRDTKDRTAGTLTFPRRHWTNFLTTLRSDH
ncbi:DUF397 domain-containing protein [Saccharopolyspora sp. NPDC002578]